MAPSAKPPPQMYAFDILASKTANPYLQNKPKSNPSNTSHDSAAAAKTPPKGTKDSISHGVKSQFPRLVNSQFKLSTGKQSTNKRKSPINSDNTSSRRQSKRHRLSNNNETPSSIATDTPVPHFHLAGIDPMSLVTPHKPIPHSSQLAFYKHLLPPQIARLSKNDEIIVVIQPMSKAKTDAVRCNI